MLKPIFEEDHLTMAGEPSFNFAFELHLVGRDKVQRSLPLVSRKIIDNFKGGAITKEKLFAGRVSWPKFRMDDVAFYADAPTEPLYTLLEPG